MKKTVTIYSFGHCHSVDYPANPGSHTIQIVLDLRMLYEPFSDGHQGSGIDETVAQMVIRENRKFLSALKPYLKESLENFRFSRKYHLFNLCFGCAGGWQRSVATAEYFKDWIVKNFPDLRIIMRHLTVEKQQI